MNFDKLKLPQSIVCAGAASLLLMAVFFHLPHGFYTLLRIAVCGAAAYMAWFSTKGSKHIWIAPFIVIAVLFNPVISIFLTKAEWTPIDLVTSGILCAWIINEYLRVGTNADKK